MRDASVSGLIKKASAARGSDPPRQLVGRKKLSSPNAFANLHSPIHNQFRRRMAATRPSLNLVSRNDRRGILRRGRMRHRVRTS